MKTEALVSLVTASILYRSIGPVFVKFTNPSHSLGYLTLFDVQATLLCTGSCPQERYDAYVTCNAG